jgi:AraC-like DNA-binding protein
MYVLFFFKFSDQTFIVGPYVQKEYSEKTLEQILIKNSLPVSNLLSLRLYYTAFPIIYSSQLQGTLTAVMQSFEPSVIAFRYRKLTGFIQNTAARTLHTDIDSTDYSVIYRRYDDERRFLNMIKNGDVENVKNAFKIMSASMANYDFLKENPTYSNPAVSFAILRVLARKAAEDSGLSVITINAITQKYVQLMDSSLNSSSHQTYIYDMLMELTDAVHEHKLALGDYSVPVQKVMEYIELHLGNEITVRSLSEITNMSISHLSKIFKSETRQTISEYIAKKRCEKAASFLKDTDYAIQDISSFVGYQDNNYFVKVFKKIYGVTPSSYRKNK